MMKFSTFVAAALLLLTGCAHRNSAAYNRLVAQDQARLRAANAARPTAQPAQKPATYTQPSIPPPTPGTEIITDPPGARIEINDEYVGDAPLTITLPQSSGHLLSTVRIVAIPNLGGEFQQSKTFLAEDDYARNPVAPRRIFFNMNLGPVTPEVNVDVHNENQ